MPTALPEGPEEGHDTRVAPAENALPLDGSARTVAGSARTVVSDRAGAPGASSPAPTRLGPYEVTGFLGAGGMAEVFAAIDAGGRRVALKVLSPSNPDPSDRRRFEREWRVLSELDHPGIVRALERGVDAASGRSYIAFELVNGGTLEHLLDSRPDGRLSVGEAVHVLSRCARALGAAHARGVIHRDVKPRNVFLTPTAEVKLGDFGIALAENASVRLTSKDDVLGTPRYLAPEVVTTSSWTPAADMYALGALAYRLLSGKVLHPHLADASSVLRAQVEAAPPSLEDEAPGVPPALSGLVARLLDKRPEGRPSAPELLLALLSAFPAEVAGSPPESLVRGVAQVARKLVQRTAASALAIGQPFLSYRIEAELGRGGMGIVYRAFHTGLKKPVALKVLLAGALPSDEARRRFHREAEAAGALKHPAIVSVLDVGEHEGTNYLTMELVEGVPLSRHLRESQDPRALLRLFAKVCDAVHHAHTRGVIHRDLKPDNVLIDRAGDPHILDFGIAKRVDANEGGEGALTAEGNILGTLLYMPPEQADGRLHEIDVRSDVYALGSTLYEIVTGGTTPFRGSVRELLRQIQFEPPRPPSVARPGLSWELDAICLKALEKECDDRYQSALELKREIERFLEGQPIAARRATALYRARKWVARNRRRAAAYGATLAALAGVVGQLALRERDKERERRGEVALQARRGWELFGRRSYDGALKAFNAAQFFATDTDALPVTPELLANLPREASTALNLRGEMRLTRERLSEWASLAARQMDEDRAGLLLGEGRRALEAGRLDDAKKALEAAETLAPVDLTIRQLLVELAGRFAREGRRLLAAGDLDGARSAFRQALVEDRSNPEAAAGLEQATRAGLAAEEDRRRAHDREMASRLVEEGRAAIAASNLVLAQRSFVKALAFEGQSKPAQEGLAETERLLAAAEARAQKDRERAEAARLADSGQKALAARRWDEARAAFLQALAFDGTSKPATDGLAELARKEDSVQRDRELSHRSAEAAQSLATARKAVERGRSLARSGIDHREVRASYFEALQAFDEALARAPDESREHAAALADKVAAARELARIANEDSNYGLAEYLLLIAGGPGATDDSPAAPIVSDPLLLVREADAVLVQRAFREPVGFEPSVGWFEGIRDETVKPWGKRFRLIVDVRTRIDGTTLYAAGLTLQVEDRERGVSSAPRRLDFDGGPFPRVVVSNTTGRVVQPFFKAHDLGAPTSEGELGRRVTAAVKEIVESLSK